MAEKKLRDDINAHNAKMGNEIQRINATINRLYN